MHLKKKLAQPDQSLLAEYLPWSFLAEEGVVQHKDGALQKTFRFRGPDLESATAHELMGVSGAFNNALRRLSDGWAVFIEAQRCPIGEYPENVWPTAASRAIDDERKSYFKQSDRYFANEYYLTLVYKAPLSLDAKSKWFMANTVTSEHDHQNQNMFFETINEVMGMLSCLFPSFESLNDDDTLTYLHSTISSRRHKIITPDIPMYLDHILCDEGVEHGLGLKLGQHFIKTLSIKSFPSETFPGILNALNDLNFPFRWSTRFLSLGQETGKAALNNFRRMWFAGRKKITTILQEIATQSESALGETSALNKSADADAAIQLLDEGLVSFGHFTATVSVWDENQKSADQKINRAAQIINRLGFSCHIETLNALDAWLSSVPGNTTANVRRPLVHTLNLAHMAPLSAMWSGEASNMHLNAAPHFFAQSNGNSPFRFSSNVGDVGHTLIFGPTGAGKSTLLSFMAAQWLKYDKAQVFIFDKGYSSRVITECNNGSFFVIGANSQQPCFQPLRNVHLDDERIWASEWLLEILSDQGLSITTEMRSEIWHSLLNLAEQELSSRTMSVFASLVQDHDVKEALIPFKVGGAYGYLFDASNEHNDDNAWQTYETAELFEKRGAVKPVLSYLFHRLHKRFDGKPTLLILDEAWLFLEDSAFAKKIEQWLKELRKANVYVIFATQSLADAMQSTIAVALKESCPTKIFLPNASARDLSSASFYSEMGLNDRQIDIIANATSKKDYYVTSPAGARLFSLALGPIALALCGSSSVDDQKMLAEIKGKCASDLFSEFVRAKAGGAHESNY
jgi:type IV secretion/conjugal transfer VirB4 family ATPase